MNDHLLSRFTQHDTSSTPGEVIHSPERIEREHEGEDWDGQNVEEHASNHIPLSPENKHEGLQTIHSANHDKRYDGKSFLLGDDLHNKIDDL